MENLLEIVKVVGMVVSAILGLTALLGKTNDKLIEHLGHVFATKHDFQRLEEKIDRAIGLRGIKRTGLKKIQPDRVDGE